MHENLQGSAGWGPLSEWLIVNRRGSYASSSASFANLRTYHGLLVKRFDDEYNRAVLLAKLYEDLYYGGKMKSLDTNFYRGAVYPEGHRFLSGFTDYPVPTFTYSVDGSRIVKRVAMDPDNDWVVIRYDFYGAAPEVMKLYPLVAFRNFHLALRERDMDLLTSQEGDVITLSTAGLELRISTGGRYFGDGIWYYNFQYPIDRERGSNYEEDLYLPGHFEVEPSGGHVEVRISASEGMPEGFEQVRRRMVGVYGSRERGPASRYSRFFETEDDIIAGFYWFGPWTRDTMISLPGLLLTRGRWRLARRIIMKYAGLVRNGMLPRNLGRDSEPSADTSLWFIYAVYKYFRYTKDSATVKALMGTMQGIIRSYLAGNEYVEVRDNLVAVKRPQLTWMDARTGDTVFTPRVGFPVEVNALWHNAVASVESMAREVGADAGLGISSGSIRESFLRKFVRGDRVLDVAEPDDAGLRPNFILAFSLPFPVMEGFDNFDGPVKEMLLTPYGLRSLSPDDPRYVGRYEGDQYHRDMAYHNGSVWPWLAGPYITAEARAGAEMGSLKEQFRPLLSMDMIPEIFDGDDPHEPRGCILQAWSHGELIRALKEDLGG